MHLLFKKTILKVTIYIFQVIHLWYKCMMCVADDGYMFEGSIEYARFHVQRIAEAKIQTKGKHMSKWERAKISNCIEL